MKRDNEKFINIVIEESSEDGDVQYKPILATTSLMKAKMKRRELYKARVYTGMSKEKWDELKNKLDEYLSSLSDKDWEDNGMFQDDANLIYEYITSEYPLDVLEKAQDIYDDQDPYYEVKIFKLRLE